MRIMTVTFAQKARGTDGRIEVRQPTITCANTGIHQPHGRALHVQ